MRKFLVFIAASLSIIWTASAQTPSPTINGVPGPFIFTGSVTQSGQTFTFSSTGGVTAVSCVTANGVSCSSSGGTTPALTFTLGAITPTTVAATGQISGPSVVSGSPSAAALAAIPSGAHGFACDETSTAGVPATGVDFLRCDSTSHTVKASFNDGAESSLPQTICTGTAALGTSAISSGAAASTVTATCTGLATTDVIELSFNGSPLAVTGYVPSANGMLTIIGWPTSNTINVSVINNTAGSITPGAITLNFRVTR